MLLLSGRVRAPLIFITWQLWTLKRSGAASTPGKSIAFVFHKLLGRRRCIVSSEEKQQDGTDDCSKDTNSDFRRESFFLLHRWLRLERNWKCDESSRWCRDSYDKKAQKISVLLFQKWNIITVTVFSSIWRIPQHRVSVTCVVRGCSVSHQMIIYPVYLLMTMLLAIWGNHPHCYEIEENVNIYFSNGTIV